MQINSGKENCDILMGNDIGKHWYNHIEPPINKIVVNIARMNRWWMLTTHRIIKHG